MPSVIGEILEVGIGAAIEFAPFLLDIPILGRILSPFRFSRHPANEAKVIEQLQASQDKDKETRKKTKQRNARYVIKVSEAMECVEKHYGNGAALWEFVKAIGRAIAGSDTAGTDVLMNEVFKCLEENRLRQDTPRVKGEPSGKYVRPRKGHGHGRGKF